MSTKDDTYYLRSILRNLREIRTIAEQQRQGWTIGCEVLADNIDWLDCYIDRLERK